MDWFDDIQIEEINKDFGEDLCEELFDENEGENAFQNYLKSNYDY
jgi:hypothetical protein